MSHRKTGLALVGYGAFLPEAGGADFFDFLLTGKSLVRDLGAKSGELGRMRPSVIHTADRRALDGAYSVFGSAIDRELVHAVARRRNLPLEEFLTLEILAIEAIHQAIDGLLPETFRGQTDLMLGICNVFHHDAGPYLKEIGDELLREEDGWLGSTEAAKFLAHELERFQPLPSKKQLICSGRMEQIRNHHRLGGACFLLDAACASSLTALSLASSRLRQGLCKYALFGGMDNNLGSTELMSCFSSLGVLSEGPLCPLDHRSTGLSPGEGAAVFLLTTMEEARRAGLPVLALVKGIGGSSDGGSGGPTEPTPEGQLLSYRRAYGAAPPQKMAYIECHGTGTKVGDRVELESLSRYFGEAEIPIGTVKYNLGHTMGAAGAMGLLKCLGVLRRRLIPPSPYFDRFPAGIRTRLSVSTVAQPIPRDSFPMNVGLSSFGFGGSNFHVWLQEHQPGSGMPEDSDAGEAPARHEVVLCAEVEAGIAELEELSRSAKRRLPPNSWPFTDKAQLLSVLLAEKMFQAIHIDPAGLDGDRIHVISGSAQPLELQLQKFKRHITSYLLELLDKKFPAYRERLHAIKNRRLKDYAVPNDLLFVGTMNNLVASRVSKAFGFRGMNFNVDGDHSAEMLALEAARNILTESPGAAIVLGSIKRFDERDQLFKNVGMKCHLLSSVEYAHEFDLPIKFKLGPMRWTRRVNARA